MNCLEYIKEHSEIIVKLYSIMFTGKFEASTVHYTLSILLFFSQASGTEGAEMVYKAAKEFSESKGSIVFKELVALLNDQNLDIKLTAFMLINTLITEIKNDKVRVHVIYELKEADITGILTKLSSYKSDNFQKQLTKFQEVMQETIS